MEPSMDTPSLVIHCKTAEVAVASVDPTPTPISIALVLKRPVMELQNACKLSHAWYVP